MADIEIYDPAEELPHRPEGDDPTWQESALFAWYDLKSGAGGFWRLGQEAIAGQLNSCFGMFTDDGLRFRSNVTGVPMSKGDRGEAHMGWGKELRVDLDTLRITADFADCEAQLQWEDFFPRYEWMQLVGMPVPEAQAKHNHWEMSGSLRGKIRIGDREMEIDALGYRDRSWGPRVWGSMRSTRWWPTVFGPDLTIHTLAVVDERGYHGSYGYMWNNGQVQSLRDVDLTVTLDYDAIGPRAGCSTFRGEDGEAGQVTHERADGVVLHVRGYTAIESVGRARYGDRVGMSNLEVCTNPTGGSKPPFWTQNANNGQGLSRR
jgi:hypothetical protein